MKIVLEEPYSKDFTSGSLVINPEGRRNVILYDDVTKNRTTTSYARYLLAVDIGRYLTEDEQADHIDEDKTNDSLDNLQILSRKDNIRKHVIAANKEARKIILRCCCCQEEIMMSLRIYKMRVKQNQKRFHCGNDKCKEYFKRMTGKRMTGNNGHRPSKTSEIIGEIKRLSKDDHSSYEIADILSISRNTVMKYWDKSPRRLITEELRKQILDFRKTGLSVKQIADKMLLSVRSVRRTIYSK